ncbi:hypothetical protein HYFRA_00011629 [Hymenoscyphus fraxineus]|uniref:Uncharacterized protein n=1 Tax=Hymenoscyphus fraxineus TaxID=746836 RepID=A0A9N9PQG6_9HELO|nr:hypothetical protein HYFRA_00011629 [Hymenoscyphus fraxineus]
MSLRGAGVINRWKERHRSNTGISSATTANSNSKSPVLRPSTSYAASAAPSIAASAAPSVPPNRDFEKIVEDAVLNAFNSDVFKAVVASQMEPHLTQQYENIDQLKTSNLNFESNVQTQFENIPRMLQPALDHLTNLEIPNYENELKELLAGQKALADSIAAFDGRLSTVETQVQEFDGRVKALQEEVVNADLRSAIRFGEISNELQDRNSTLSDRFWNFERELGRKIEGQQRRVVGACEEIRKAIVVTQDKISSLETLHIGFEDKLTSDGERSENLSKKIDLVSKAISKLDSAEVVIQQDIKTIHETVSALDLTPLGHIPRRLDGMDRAISDIKRSIETQTAIASLDAKIVSGNNARIDNLASSVGKMGKLIEDVHEHVCDDSEFDLTTEKLESIESKIVSLDDALENVRKNIKTMDTSALDSLKANVSALQSSVDTGFSSEKNSLEMIHNHLSLLPDSSKIDSIFSAMESNQTATIEKIDGLENSLEVLSEIAASTSEAISSHSVALDSAHGAIVSLHRETTSHFEPLGSSIAAVSQQVGFGNDAITGLGSKFGDFLSQHEAHITNLADISSRVGSENDLLRSLGSQIDLVITKSDVHHALLSELKENDKSVEIIAILENGKQSQIDHFSILGQDLDATKKYLENAQESTLSEIRTQTSIITSTFGNSNKSRQQHTTSNTEAKAFQEERFKILDGQFSALNAAVAKSHTVIASIQGTVGSILPELEALKGSYYDHATSLSEILDLNKLHSTSLSDIHSSSGEIVRGLQKSHLAAANLSSTLGEFSEAIARKDDIGDLHAMLSTILEGLDKHAGSLSQLSTSASIAELKGDISSAHDSRRDDSANTHSILSAVLEATNKHAMVLQRLSTAEAVQELKGEVSASHDLLTTHSTTLSRVKDAVTDTAILDMAKNTNTSVNGVTDRINTLDKELKAGLSVVKSLGEANTTSIQEVRSTLETSDIAHTIKAILDGTLSNKHQILEEAQAIKTALSEFRSSSREKAILSEISSVRDMVQKLPEECKTENILHQIKTAVDLSDKNRASLVLVLESLKTISDNSSLAEILANVGILTSLVEDVRATQQDSQISELVESLNGTVSQHTCSIQDIHDNVRHVMDDTSSIKQIKDTILDVHKHTTAIPNVQDEIRKAREELSTSSSHALNDLNSVKQNGTQQGAALARTYDALLALDTKVKASEDFVYAAVQKLHSTMERELADNRSSIATSVGDVASDLKIDLHTLGSRLSTSTNVLRSDLKSIDLGPMQTIVNQLKEDVHSIRESTAETAENVAAIPVSFATTNALLTSETTKTCESVADLTRLVKSHGDLQRGNSRAIEEKIEHNTVTLSSIDKTTSEMRDGVSSIVKEQLPKISNDIRAIDLNKLSSDTAESAKVLTDVGHTVKELAKTTEVLVAELSNTKEHVTKTSGQILSQLTTETAKVVDITREVELSAQSRSLETSTVVKENATMLSHISKTVGETPSKVEASLNKETALLAEAIRAVHDELSREAARNSKVATDSSSALSTITAEISNLSSSTESKISTLHTDLTTTHLPELLSEIGATRTALESSNSFSFQALSADLKSVTSAISTTSAAVRVNSAAISRVDKAVLETGAHVKGVIYEGNRQISSEIESALSQLDESIHDNGTRIRGISEYDIPRMETEIQTLDQSVERLIETSNRTGERHKDALMVIGGRIIGTSKKFGEMVDAAQKGELDNGHGHGHGHSHGSHKTVHAPDNGQSPQPTRGSRILGTAKAETGGSGRFRRPSNASTRDSSKDSRVMGFHSSQDGK